MEKKATRRILLSFLLFREDPVLLDLVRITGLNRT